MADILVVDDDQSVASAFQSFLTFEGHTCRLASDAGEAMRLIAERRPALVMMDVRMPGVDGLSALKDIRNTFPDIYVVMMTGYGTSQTSIDAIRAGAYDYLTKPLDLDEIRGVIRKALDAQQARTSAVDSAAAPGVEPLPRLVGNTPAMREVYKTIGRLAAIDVPALVVGEHGTGKQLVIATIHESSARRAQPFRMLDCATLSQAAIESALFDEASGGTVQLAQIETLPASLQTRLAQGLGDTLARGATGSQPRARVLASTDVDLQALAQAGSFNRALCAALAVVTVKLPPLRDRREDIPLLVRHFIQRFNADFDRAIAGVDERVMRVLLEHRWPGNVDELETVVKRGCILARSDVITTGEVGESLGEQWTVSRRDAESALAVAARTALQERLVNAADATSPSAYHDIIEVVETTLVQEALAITNGNQVKAAAVLGVNRATLRKKIPAESN